MYHLSLFNTIDASSTPHHFDDFTPIGELRATLLKLSFYMILRFLYLYQRIYNKIYNENDH